jgi:hypothetical protein
MSLERGVVPEQGSSVKSEGVRAKLQFCNVIQSTNHTSTGSSATLVLTPTFK